MISRRNIVAGSGVAAVSLAIPSLGTARVGDPLVVIVRAANESYNARSWIECWSERDPKGFTPYEALLHFVHGWGSKSEVKGSLDDALSGNGALDITLGAEELMQGVLVRESCLGEYLSPAEMEWRSLPDEEKRARAKRALVEHQAKRAAQRQ